MNRRFPNRYFLVALVASAVSAYVFLVSHIARVQQRQVRETVAADGDHVTRLDGLACPGCNLLLITVDTVRADQLPCYGYPRNTAPNICALSDRGMLFENAYSAAPSTLPALASLMTGSLVSNSSIADILSHFDRQRSLPDVLKAQGYLTAGFTDHAGIGGVGRGSLVPVKGLDTFHNVNGSRQTLTSGPLTEAALDWVEENKDERFFLWIHYFDPHLNYAPPPEMETMFGFDRATCGRVRNNMDIPEIRKIEKTLSPREVDCLIALHDAETYYTDQYIGRLLGRLGQLGLKKNTVVVLTADHGEEFLERSRVGHEWTVYDELVHVPLIIANPGRPKVERIDSPIGTPSLYELLPAVVKGEAIRIDRPVIARTYHYYVTQETDPTRPNAFALVQGNDKLIHTPATGETELFDVGYDPGERVDLAATAPAAALQAELEQWLDDHRVTVPPPRPELMESHEATNEVLRRLGYVR